MICTRKGFTLLELLAVIAIIVILAGMLFPALRTMQARGQKAACLSNLRQWGVGMKDFLVDSGGVFPTEGSDENGTMRLTETSAWFNVLAPYVGERSPLERTGIPPVPQPRPKDGSLYTCPSVTMQDMINYERENGTLDEYEDPFLCYAMNLWIDHADRPAPSGKTRSSFGERLRISQILKPSKFVVFGDSAGNKGNLHAAFCAYRHDGNTTVNLCFADGHAATHKKADVYVDAAEGGYKMKNRGGIIWNPEGEPPQDSDEF